MSFAQPHAAQQMRVHMLQFTETGTFNPMHFRPYETDMNDRSMSGIVEATAHGTRVDPASLAGVAGMFMRPSTEAGQIIQVPNGWNTPRMRFVMQLEYPAFAGGRVIQYVSGFTNKSDLSFSRQLDPNMLLYFNNSLLLQEINEQTPMGPRATMRVVSADQILGVEALGVPSHIAGSASGLRTLRPEDMFSVLSTAQFAGGPAMDLRPTFLPTEPLKKSSRKNNQIANYLARSIERSAVTASEADWDASSSDIASRTSAKLAEASMVHDNFISWIKARGVMTSGGAVPWGELMAHAPEADHVAKVTMTTGPQMHALQSAGSSEYWNGGTHETIFASILSQSVPGIMMDSLVGKFAFRATNRIADQFGRAVGHGPQSAAHQVFITDGRTLNGDNLANVGHNLINKLVYEILPEVSMSGMIDYDVTARFDIFGNSMLSISVGGQPNVDYTVPSFCDSLFTPIVTANPNGVNQLASDIGAMVHHMQDVSRPPAAQNLIQSPYGF